MLPRLTGDRIVRIAAQRQLIKCNENWSLLSDRPWYEGAKRSPAVLDMDFCCMRDLAD